MKYVLLIGHLHCQNLLEKIQDEFLFGKNIKTFEHLDIGHGRIETRKCSVITDFIFIKNPDEKWKNLNQIIKIDSIREFKNSDRKPKMLRNITLQVGL